MATARRKATGSARQRGADNRWLDPLATLSLRPLGRHSLSVGGPPKNLPVGAPRWRRRGEKLRGQQGNEALTTAGPLATLSLRPLGRHSLSVGGPPKNLPVGAPRWRRRGEKLRGQQGNEALTTAGPLATLSLRPLGRHSLSVGGPPKNLPVGAPRWRRRGEKLRGQQGNEALTTAGPLATLSLRPLGRHSLSVGGPPKNLPVGAPRWRRRGEKLRGQQGNEALTTAG